VALGWFSVRAAGAWLVSGYLDPVSLFPAQDEATYSRIVLEMVERGNWLMPTFLDRIAFFKPPLLYWLSGLSVEAFGISAYALRLPSVLAAAGTCAVAFRWVARSRGIVPGLVTAILLASNYYWVALGSLNVTDGLLVFLSLCALYAVGSDPELSGKTLAVTSVALGAAVMTKSIAAIPTIVVLAAYLGLIRLRSGERRAGLGRVVVLVTGPFILASPWFVWALAFHLRWFWKEHILTEVLGRNAAGASLGTPLENAVFYFQRLAWPDPILAVAGVAALIWVIVGRRNGQPTLVLLWMGLTAAAVLVFGYHYRGANYLLPIITGLALLTGLALPALRMRWGVVLVCVLLAAEAWKVSRDARIVWRGTNIPAAPALVSYCEERRNHLLMVIETDDEFFSASQPLARVSYGLIGQGRAAVVLPIDYQSLGIIATSQEYDNRRETWPVFRERLTAMGLPAWYDPRATEVLFRNDEDVRGFIREHAEVDFLIPERYAQGGLGRGMERADGGHVFLLASAADAEAPRAGVHRWSCAI
jgi:4-amino-4-deoxy-L-arabinose transferase-like glycosyltransferase